MRRIHAWVALVFSKLIALCSVLYRTLSSALAPLLGQFQWRAPSWGITLVEKLQPLAHWVHQRAAWALLAVVLLAAGTWSALHGPAGGWKTWWQWQTLNGAQATHTEIQETRVRLSAPEPTPYDGDAKPRPLILDFSASAAPLILVGKEALDVTLTPALAGQWTWVSAQRLEFLPAQDWPIGVNYQLRLGSKTLAAHIKNTQREFNFLSPAFKLDIQQANFYQDPVQVTLRKAVFDVHFSHPVNPEVFEKKLKLKIESADPKMLALNNSTSQWTVTYDKLRLNASVHSVPLPIPQTPATLALHIDAGVTAQRGGNGTANELIKAVTLPGLFSLDITELKQLIVTGESGEPENVLQITAGMNVHEKEMAQGLSAWLLPTQHPDKQREQQIYAWNDPSEVNDAVLKQAKKVVLNPLPAEREFNETHAWKFSAEPGRYLLVRVRKGLKSAGGYQLAETRDEIIRVKRSAPELSIMSQGSLLALSGEKKLPVLARDLPGVRVEIGRLLPQQLQHLVTQSQGDMTRPEFYSGITPDSLTERFEKKIPLSLKRGKTHFETIDFSDYLRADANDRRGIFLLTVQGYDPKEKSPQNTNDASPSEGHSEYGEEGSETDAAVDDAEEKNDPTRLRDRRLVIVTDLGIVAKQAVDGARDVFVQSIANGQPVVGATVEIWARNGAVLVSQSTDATGRAQLPSVKGLTREKQAAVLIVRKQGDLSFLPLNRADRNLDTSRFDVGGVYSAGMPNQIQAYLFSDRGIYRPGDTMNIAILAKSANWEQKLTDLPVEVEVIDARGLTVRREKMKLGTSGAAEFVHTTQDTSPTGNYNINLNLARDNGSATPGVPEAPPLRLGSVSVKVQEFMPDRMKVSAQLSNETSEGWVTPQDLKTRVQVQNLFGTPAQNRRVEARLTLSPTYPAFRRYADYRFYDPLRAKQSFNSKLENATTDQQGNAEFDLGLQRYEKATYQMHVLVQAFEPEGGRAVAAETTALVSDRPYLIGYKVDGDLGYIARNSTRQVNLIAIDAKAKKIAVSDLRLVRLERKSVSILVKQSNGLYKYESRAREIVLKEDPFTIAVAGNQVVLATQTPGNFAYALRDAAGLELARVEYSVAGNGNVSRSLDRNAELQMTLNKKDYEPGEDIEINIRAPYVGAGLITIERDKVYTHRWFRTTETASIQKISLPKDFEGNGYVSVQFMRDLASNEIYMSPMSYGIAPFATSLARRSNEVKLHAPELLKPGQTATFKLESKTPSRAIVFAVDEGILQVARYTAPDPLKFFFQKRALEVSTQQTLDLVLPEFKKLMQAAPGGDAAGESGKHLNPFKRRTDKPVVFWSGWVEVNGSRELSYTVPENFNGALRVMAITVNDDTVAAASTQTTVRGDLVLLPTVPVAITPGDEVEIGVGVANNAKGSGKDAAVQLSLAVAPGLEVIGTAAQTLKISERAEGATTFRIRAKPGAQAQLGSASVVFTAQTGNAKARLSTDLSVRPASALVTLVQSGLFRGPAELTSQTDLYPNFKQNEVALSSSPQAFSSGLTQYLQSYPYACTEQITSQAFPLVLLATQSSGLKNKTVDPQQALNRYLSLMRARQSADGGFAMWPGANADLFASTYVVNLLVEARARKFTVPNDMLQRANGYLQARLAEVSRYDYQWRVQAQAAYLLARQGIVVQAALINLNENLRQRVTQARNDEERLRLRRDLGAVYLASAFQLLKQEKIAQELLQPALNELMTAAGPLKNWDWNYYYDPLVHQATALQLVALHFPKFITQLPMEYWSRLAKAIDDNYYQSLSAARILLAIDAYGTQAAQSAAGKMSASAVTASGVVKELALPQQLALEKLALPLDTAKLRLNNGGELPLFYSWAETGYERALPTQATQQGLEIIHEFLDAKGAVINEAQIGDELTVRVRVRATERTQLEQVALVDVLPGGMEPILTAPSDSDAPDTPLWRRRLGGTSTWAIDYADIREDRVIFFGKVSNILTEVTYKVRATNAGEFVVPAAYGEAMYERRIFGRSAGATFKVKAVK